MGRLNRRQVKQFWQEFREFALKGNVIDLAIAVVVGGAFGRIVTSVVEDLIMPLVNPLIPGGDWRELTVGSGIRIGKFLGSLLDFGVIALSLFILLKLILPLLPKKPPAPEQRECPYCLESVPLKASRCRACTSELPPL
ncbi:large conductance mechanosensitive channel protein MscL [Thermosynechococcus sp. QS41]|uniref:large conductance mechanosensitive channel protein MscL n=1 Tax=unclassified Thermosynechococcus TaxID=2622553 RepID=UPI0021021FFE|nr:large conductance mechanosensitive channel protein MscL [Thermosynechococcus sp. QS41]